MISGSIFILISWLVIPHVPGLLWLSIILTIFGSIKILFSFFKFVVAFFKGSREDDE